MSVVLLGSTSGSVTLQEPAVAGSTVIDLPATSGTMAVLPTATSVLPQASGGTGTTTGYYGFKNRLINGGMVIDQRNAGASVTPTATGYTLDRWSYELTEASKMSVQQNAGSLSAANRPAGFTNYLGLTTVSAFSITSTSQFQLRQFVEGFNFADLMWGTANAVSTTLSFWVRSSLTGTFGGSLRNIDSNRSYPFSYTINAANTWEQKAITIAGDTTGTWNTTNDRGVGLFFGLGVGSTYSGTAGAWAAANYTSATGATSVVGTASATFYITGVQLEKGSTATSFDYRPYGTELALCQRYYYKVGPSLGNDINLAFNGFAATTTLALLTVPFPVTMRTSPSALEQSGTSADYAVRYAGGSIANCSAVPNFQSSYTLGAQVGLIVASGLTAGGTISGRSGSATGNNSYFGWSAEL
jgi:hypothetical protein